MLHQVSLQTSNCWCSRCSPFHAAFRFCFKYLFIFLGSCTQILHFCRWCEQHNGGTKKNKRHNDKIKVAHLCSRDRSCKKTNLVWRGVVQRVGPSLTWQKKKKSPPISAILSYISRAPSSQSNSILEELHTCIPALRVPAQPLQAWVVKK